MSNNETIRNKIGNVRRTYAKYDLDAETWKISSEDGKFIPIENNLYRMGLTNFMGYVVIRYDDKRDTCYIGISCDSAFPDVETLVLKDDSDSYDELSNYFA